MASESTVCVANNQYYSDFLRKEERNMSNFEETDEISFGDFVAMQRERKQAFIRATKTEFRANIRLYFNAEHEISSSQLEMRHFEVNICVLKMFSLKITC